MLTRRTFLTALTCSVLAPMARAQRKPVFFATDGAAISGYDPVSYFDAAGPVPGRSDIALMWKGAVWRFASKENCERFELNPRAFAPQYGGYCAYAMAKGRLVNSDPLAWKIYEDRLYLTHSVAVERVWQENLSANIRLADENWPAVLRS